jgi:hypothetical protein
MLPDRRNIGVRFRHIATRLRLVANGHESLPHRLAADYAAAEGGAGAQK